MLARSNVVAAYLYLHLGEQMPHDAPDEWFLQPDPNQVHIDDVERFLTEVERLVGRLEQMDPDASEDDFQTEFYDAAKATFDGDKRMIRTFFAWLYLVIFYRDHGPRWGVMVSAIGRDEFVNLIRERFAALG